MRRRGSIINIRSIVGATRMPLAQQRTLAVILAIALAGKVASSFSAAGGRLVDADANRAQPPACLVDINQAEWPELTLLPQIGEALAQRIVAHRQSRGYFQSTEQLLHVHGIGPKKLANIEPFLFIDQPTY